MESFNFGAFDTQLPGRIAAIPQEAEKQRTANMLQAMQMQGAMNQNELARYSLASAQRSDASQNAVNDALKKSIVNGTLDYDALFTNLAGGAGAAKIPDFIKARAEELERKLKIKKLEGDVDEQARKTVDSELTSFAKNAPRVTDVPSLTNHLKAFFGHPLLGKIASRFKTYEQALADDIQQISTPEGLSRWQTENANLTGKELIELLKKVTKRTQNVGTEDITFTENQLGQQIGPVVRTPIGVSPNTTATLKQQQDHFNSLSAFQKRQLADAGWSFDTERGIAVNAKRGISQPISTLMTPVSGGGAPAVGGATAPIIALDGGVPGQRQAPAGQPVAGVLGPKPEKPSTEYLKAATGIVNTNYAINNLKQLTNNFTAADMLNPARRAEIEAAHSTAVLLAKDMFGLGVLNEGDERILRKIIPDATAFSKGLVPIETIRKNLLSATNVINRMNETSAKIHKQPLLTLDSMTPSAPSPSAPPIQSFRRQ